MKISLLNELWIKKVSFLAFLIHSDCSFQALLLKISIWGGSGGNVLGFKISSDFVDQITARALSKSKVYLVKRNNKKDFKILRFIIDVYRLCNIFV